MTEKANQHAVGIRRAYRTPEGEKIFEFEGPTGVCWFTGTEVINHDAKVRTRIHLKAGVLMSSSRDMAIYRDQAMAWTDFGTGVLANHPGWHGNTFVLGDGQVIRSSSTDFCAASFAPNDKFRPVGTLDEWKENVAPFLDGQHLPLAALAFALAGPIMRFVPSSDFMPPQMEVFGDPSSGKSTIGILAASIWAGATGDVGGGETWQTTIAAVEKVRRQHADMFLYQDDATSAPGDKDARMQLRVSTALSTAGTGEKKRYDDDPGSPVIRVPRLCSANYSLVDATNRMQPDERHALLERLMFIRVSQAGREGSATLFDPVPTGWHSAAEAATAMRRASSRVYGVAGRTLVKYLVGRLDAEGNAFVRSMESRFDTALDGLISARLDIPLRHLKMLSALQIALEVGIEAGAIEGRWGEPAEVIDALCHSLHYQIPAPDYRRMLMRLLGTKLRNRVPAIETKFLPTPRRPSFLSGMFERRGQALRIYIDPDTLVASGWTSGMLRAARRIGLLITHPSEPHRLTMRAPAPMARLGFGRVHVFELIDLQSTS